MSSKNVPAFPMGNPEQGGYDGMTLRDYFAAKAMAGFAGLPEDEAMGAADCAKAAYNYADAMLSEREKGGAA